VNHGDFGGNGLAGGSGVVLPAVAFLVQRGAVAAVLGLALAFFVAPRSAD